MASNVVSNDPYLSPRDRRPRPAARTANSWEALLRPLASLKLTVVLFSFAIFIVFAGTVAQVDHDVWGVVHHYFRSFFTWIDFRIFFPRDWNISGGFPFPGGWLIGVLLIVNLLAAHGLRFKVQARGKRLAAGLAVIAAGILVTWCIISAPATLGATAVAAAHGSPEHAVQSMIDRFLEWLGAGVLWNGMKLGLAAMLGVTVYFVVVLDWKRRFELGLLSAAAAVEGSLLGWLLYHSDFTPDPSSMRILWQLVEGGFAGAVLLAGCVLAFKKRGAIVLIHAGVALMMFNELYVGMTADEAQMRLKPGAIQRYVDDIRTVELAVVDSSGKNKDDVVVIPKQMLRPDNVISDPRLRFDVKVVEFMQNSDLKPPTPKDEKNLATAGIGKELIAEPQPPVTGTDTDSNVDITSAYVEFLKKGTSQSLGTYLVSVGLMDEVQPVTVDGTNYEVALRFKRTYKDYVVKLLGASKQNYPGTEMARSYSSDIHLVDPTNGTDVDHHIWMNNPLRYKGDTFYQSGFSQDPKTGEAQTTLTVVANRGWMIPYIGCMIVAVGLLAHFLTVLTRFLRRRAAGSLDPREDDEPSVPMAELAGDSKANRPWLQTASEFFPWIAVAVLAGWAISHAIPPRAAPDTMDLYKFGELPVVYEGRVKPFDTLARTALKAISERQTWVDNDGHRHSAIEWLLELITDPDAAAKERVFRIENAELRDILRSGITKTKGPEAVGQTLTDEIAEKLTEKPADKTTDGKSATVTTKRPEEILEEREGLRYSLSEFRDGLKEFSRQREKVRKIKPAERNTIQRQIVEFDERLSVYFAILDSFQSPEIPAIPTPEEVKQDPDAARARAIEIGDYLRNLHATLAGMQAPLSVPPIKTDAEWQTFAEAASLASVEQQIHAPNINPNTLSLAAILRNYAKKDAYLFNAFVAKYRDSLLASPPKLVSENENRTAWLSGAAVVCQKLGLIEHADKIDFEAFFNHFEPFYYGLVLYLIAFLLTCFALLGWSVPLNRAAFWLVAVTLVIHTLAMIGRIYISGRPPVTNLYSAALFIGWAAVGFGLVLELVYRMGIGTMIGALAGFMTLVIAHFLATSGDTFTVMEAVLDTQFWLATHVTCITLGYATTFFAGLIGTRYIVQGVLTPSLPSAEGKAMIRMIYGVLCFAIFFSFVGTVLGGLWADDSWGRFWGWDPKENGALIIVIWNALVLHARWDGMVKDRGLAALSLGGIIAVAWSGFGVNQLGAGLHSYGFTSGVALWVAITVAVSLALIGLASIPKRHWRSFRQAPPETMA